jgi:hypothetical protein
MERIGLKPAAFKDDSLESYSTLPSKTKSAEQKKREYNTFYDSIGIGTDFLHATDGAPLEVENYTALYDSGLATYSTEEVLTVFDDWPEFQSFVSQHYSDDVWERWKDKQQILGDIRSRALPTGLLNKVVPSAEAGRSEFADELVSPDEQIQRYYRYELARRMLSANTEPDRIVSIAVGMNIKTGRSHSTSYASEITKSSQIIKAEDVEMAALDTGLFDYIYPEVRESYLKEVRLKSRYKPPKDAASNAGEVLYDINTGNLLIGVGRAAIEAYLLETGAYASDLISLEQALTDPELSVNFAHQRAYTYKNYKESDYIQYARWLNDAIIDKDVTARLLRRANHLGFGPGPEQIKSRFKSLINLYEKAGLDTKNAKYRYDDLSDDDVIAILKSAAAENEGKISAPYLAKRLSEGKSGLPPDWLRHKYGSLANIFEAAGLRTSNSPVSAMACLAIGAEHFRKTGELLDGKTIDSDSGLPSRFPFYKNFGGIKGYQQSLKAHLENEELAA